VRLSDLTLGDLQTALEMFFQRIGSVDAPVSIALTDDGFLRIQAEADLKAVAEYTAVRDAKLAQYKELLGLTE
jgi:hypothetical protein